MTSSTRTFKSLGADGPLDIDVDEEVRLSYESVKNVDVLDVSPGESLRKGKKMVLTLRRGI